MDPCGRYTEEKYKKVHKGKELDKVPSKLTGTDMQMTMMCAISKEGLHRVLFVSTISISSYCTDYRGSQPC